MAGGLGPPVTDTAVCWSCKGKSDRAKLQIVKANLIGLPPCSPSCPQFRNEGIDLTHNPEFTTCEFYQVRLCGAAGLARVILGGDPMCLVSGVNDLRVLPGAA